MHFLHQLKMTEFTSYIFDLAQNAIQAQACHLTIKIIKNKYLTLELIDDGRGIDDNIINHITSPFYTTRTTRSIGLGLSLISLLSEQTNGTFKIRSKKGNGTHLKVTFNHHHLDFPKEGDYGLLIADIICHQSLDHVTFIYQINHHRLIWKQTHCNRTKIVSDINQKIKLIEESYENIR